MLATSLQDVKLNFDISNKSIRAVRSTTTPSAKLLEALKKSGNLTSELRVWTDQQLKEITQAAVKSGNPAKGELIYRRKELSCLKCHSIGEAGGGCEWLDKGLDIVSFPLSKEAARLRLEGSC